MTLDEATSSRDSESAALVRALDLMTGRTTFVSAHRLSTIGRADRMLVLDEGHILQQGSHGQLMLEGGLYRSLYETQFPGENLASGG